MEINRINNIIFSNASNSENKGFKYSTNPDIEKDSFISSKNSVSFGSNEGDVIRTIIARLLIFIDDLGYKVTPKEIGDLLEEMQRKLSDIPEYLKNKAFFLSREKEAELEKIPLKNIKSKINLNLIKDKDKRFLAKSILSKEEVINLPKQLEGCRKYNNYQNCISLKRDSLKNDFGKDFIKKMGLDKDSNYVIEYHNIGNPEYCLNVFKGKIPNGEINRVIQVGITNDEKSVEYVHVHDVETHFVQHLSEL